jgi:hypothetical protein
MIKEMEMPSQRKKENNNKQAACVTGDQRMDNPEQLALCARS